MENFYQTKSAFEPDFEPSDKIATKIRDINVLVIGAGGLGCEILKNLVYSGFRNISVIDMDTIDITNLNRQFLFREEDVGKPKAEIAAQIINSRIGDNAVTPYFCKIQEKDEGFYYEFDIVICGLDSIEARRWISAMYVGMVNDDDERSLKVIIDGGTEGFKGQTRVIIPTVTACHECAVEMHGQRVRYPICTIANTPRQPEHCIEWAALIEWEKEKDRKADLDDPEDVAWIYGRAKKRAEQFGIAGVTIQLVQGVVKNIIPAIATTNAIISASCVNEAVKVASGCHPMLNNYMLYVGEDGVYSHTFELEKKTECLICGSFSMKMDVSAEATLSELLEMLETHPKLLFKKPSVSINGKPIYLQAPPTLEIKYRPNLLKPLSVLFASGSVLSVTDPSLLTSVSLTIAFL